MLFENMNLMSRKNRLNKSLSRFENQLLWKLTQPAECMMCSIAFLLPNLDSNAEAAKGALCLLKRDNLELNTGSYEVKFFSLVLERVLYQLEVNAEVKIERPRPNLIVIDHVNQANSYIFKFLDSDEAKAFSALLSLKICQLKRSLFARSLTKDDIGPPTDFRYLDVKAWNTVRQLDETDLPANKSHKSKWKPKISLSNLPRINLTRPLKRSADEPAKARSERFKFGTQRLWSEDEPETERSFFKSVSNAVRKVKKKPEKLEETAHEDDKAPLLVVV